MDIDIDIDIPRERSPSSNTNSSRESSVYSKLSSIPYHERMVFQNDNLFWSK